jgi:hypothetical protein
VRRPEDPVHTVEPVDPDPKDLQAIGSDLGQALLILEELRLGNALDEALGLLEGRRPRPKRPCRQSKALPRQNG